MMYNILLKDNIDREKAGKDFVYSQADRVILTEMLTAINQRLGTNIYYLAELVAYNLSGISDIINGYINKFASQSVRAYLLPLLISDRLPNCDETVFQLYLGFKGSKEYIAEQGMPAPANIYSRYDHTLKELKPRRLQCQLVDLICNPRDAFYLPFTTKMVASWKPADLCGVLQRYALGSNITAQDVGLPENAKNYYPSVDVMEREIRFSAIAGLKHYPTDKTLEVLERCSSDLDVDISKAAQKCIKGIKNKRKVLLSPQINS